MAIDLFVFGATGDLFKRKVYPAIKEIKKDIRVFAIGRKDIETKEFLDKYVGSYDDKIEYLRINYSDEKEYSKIISLIRDEGIFYISTPPSVFTEILSNLNKTDFKGKKIKIAFEKPFGVGMSSFEELALLAKEKLKEEQIFLIDHYLGKLGVVKIKEFVSSKKYEKYWNSNYIKKIKIIAKEDIGIEGRAGYYDEMGAIKEMVQNHLIQILLLVISNPEDKNREKILETARIEESVQGQYLEYEKEIGKKSDSETFVKLKLKLSDERWKDTEIEIITGKKMDKKETKVVVEFLKKEEVPREIIFEIFPFERICRKDENDCVCEIEKEMGKNSYINILNSIIEDKREFFPKENELRESWKLVNKIEKNELKIYNSKSNEKEI